MAEDDKRERWREWKCKVCGNSFRASRVDAQFCSGRCRKYWSVNHQPYPYMRKEPVTPPIPGMEDEPCEPALPVIDPPKLSSPCVTTTMKPEDLSSVKPAMQLGKKAGRKSKDKIGKKKTPKSNSKKKPTPTAKKERK